LVANGSKWTSAGASETTLLTQSGHEQLEIVALQTGLFASFR
jgi:hypothetical protein